LRLEGKWIPKKDAGIDGIEGFSHTETEIIQTSEVRVLKKILYLLNKIKMNSILEWELNFKDPIFTRDVLNKIQDHGDEYDKAVAIGEALDDYIKEWGIRWISDTNNLVKMLPKKIWENLYFFSVTLTAESVDNNDKGPWAYYIINTKNPEKSYISFFSSREEDPFRDKWNYNYFFEDIKTWEIDSDWFAKISHPINETETITLKPSSQFKISQMALGSETSKKKLFTRLSNSIPEETKKKIITYLKEKSPDSIYLKEGCKYLLDEAIINLYLNPVKDNNDRYERAKKLLDKKSLTDAEKKAILAAHDVGWDPFDLKTSEKKAKVTILSKAGFKGEEIKKLLWSALCGGLSDKIKLYIKSLTGLTALWWGWLAGMAALYGEDIASAGITGAVIGAMFWLSGIGVSKILFKKRQAEKTLESKLYHQNVLYKDDKYALEQDTANDLWTVVKYTKNKDEDSKRTSFQIPWFYNNLDYILKIKDGKIYATKRNDSSNKNMILNINKDLTEINKARIKEIAQKLDLTNLVIGKEENDGVVDLMLTWKKRGWKNFEIQFKLNPKGKITITRNWKKPKGYFPSNTNITKQIHTNNEGVRNEIKNDINQAIAEYEEED